MKEQEVKIKVSRFEFAIIEALNDPDYANKYESFTEAEEFTQRKQNIQKQFDNITKQTDKPC